jgi:hypothetical protein
MGGYGGGINIVPDIEPFFKKISYLPLIGNENSLDDKNVFMLSADADNKIWVANSLGGVAIYDKENKIKNLENITKQTCNFSATCVYKDSDNDIWIGSDNGKIFLVDAKSHSLKKQIYIDGVQDNTPIYGFLKTRNKHMGEYRYGAIC